MVSVVYVCLDYVKGEKKYKCFIGEKVIFYLLSINYIFVCKFLLIGVWVVLLVGFFFI